MTAEPPSPPGDTGPPSDAVSPSDAIPPVPAAPEDAPPQYPQPQYVPAPAAPANRIRATWQRRAETDYIFDFPTALGWTILTCGFYSIYVVYQLMRRSHEHNLRRIEMLDAAATFAWQRSEARGVTAELRSSFDTIATQMAILRAQTTEFRDPTIWALITLVANGIARIVAFILLNGDLVTHDYAEGAIEHELSTIYARLGAPIAHPDPTRLNQRHNYVGRVVAAIFTCGIYTFWWEYDVMTEGNRHFQANWAWEDDLANSVQQLLAAA